MQHSIIRQKVIVENENGLHLIPGSLISKLANEFGGEIRIVIGTTTANARSVLDIIALKAGCGTEWTLEPSGEGAAEIIERMVALFASKFAVDDEES